MIRTTIAAHLRRLADRLDLILYTPEGLASWRGREWMLDDLKRKAEECARQRAEFEAVEISPAARGWRT